MKIKGKVAIVTGGGSGIGRVSCLRLAKLGASVVVADINAAAAEETAQLCGGRAYQIDVSSARACADLIHSVKKVDILHNNAGLLTNSEDFLSAPPDRLVKLVNTNLTGLMLLTQAAAHGMTAHGGVIVNTASVSGLRPWPLDPIYSASKAGVVFFTRAVAEQLKAFNIRVNAVCPGYIDTDMVAAVKEEVRADIIAGIPVGRLGAPGEIAEAVSYLASGNYDDRHARLAARKTFKACRAPSNPLSSPWTVFHVFHPVGTAGGNER